MAWESNMNYVLKCEDRPLNGQDIKKLNRLYKFYKNEEDFVNELGNFRPRNWYDLFKENKDKTLRDLEKFGELIFKCILSSSLIIKNKLLSQFYGDFLKKKSKLKSSPDDLPFFSKIDEEFENWLLHYDESDEVKFNKIIQKTTGFKTN